MDVGEQIRIAAGEQDGVFGGPAAGIRIIIPCTEAGEAGVVVIEAACKTKGLEAGVAVLGDLSPDIIVDRRCCINPEESPYQGDERTETEVSGDELTAAFVGDAKVLPDWVDPLPTEESIATVAADGAYDTHACHQAVQNRQANALIPPRTGSPGHPGLKTSPIRALASWRGFNKMDARRGSSRVVIIGVASPKQRCFASKTSLAVA